MGAMLVRGGTNLVLNYALIFGTLGMPELGIRGAAWGSLIAEIAAFALLTGYALVRLPIDRYRLFRLEGLDRVLTGLIMRLSTPVGLDALLETGRWLCLFLIIERMGETPLAAANIVFACLSVLLIPILGFSEAACTMVSNLIGQGRSAELYPLLKKVTGMAAMLVAPLLLVAALVPEGLLAIFSEDPSVVTASVPSLRVVAVAVVVILLAEMMVSAISGTGDTGVTFAIGGIYTLVTLVYAYFAGVVYDLGLAWVWSAEIAGWLLVLAIAAFWLRMGYWRRLEI
jgi:Na+-driven multidrug efflux pump